jgi:hypothetical protein
MGYVILQYSEKIGFRVDYEDFKDPTAKDYESEETDPDAIVLSEVAPLIQDGKLDEAITVIEKSKRQQPICGLDLSERYYNLLKMRKRKAGLLAYGVKHLDILTEKAKKVLGVIINKYPDHDIMPHVESFLARL